MFLLALAWSGGIFSGRVLLRNTQGGRVMVPLTRPLLAKDTPTHDELTDIAGHKEALPFLHFEQGGSEGGHSGAHPSEGKWDPELGRHF